MRFMRYLHKNEYGVHMLWITKITAKQHIYGCYLGQNAHGRVTGNFLLTSENVRAFHLQDLWFKADIETRLSSDVKASSALVYYICFYCTSGTWEGALVLIDQALCYSDNKICLISCIQPYFTVRSHDIQYTVSDIGKCLRSGASYFSDWNRCVQSSANSCVF